MAQGLGCTSGSWSRAPRARTPPKERHTRCQCVELTSLSCGGPVGRRCRVVSRAAGNWDDWQGRESNTASQYPDVSLLTQTEKVLLSTQA
jgi:hypothetical protein